MRITKEQLDALKRTVEYADRYHEECEEDRYSDTEELWNIIKMFSGNVSSILDSIETNTEQLAEAARPIDDADWGSERQISAENKFVDAVYANLTNDEGRAWHRYSLKATTNEMIDYGLKIFNSLKTG